jgi:hypothetical protein
MRPHASTKQIEIRSFSRGQDHWLRRIPFQQVVLECSGDRDELTGKSLHLSA